MRTCGNAEDRRGRRLLDASARGAGRGRRLMLPPPNSADKTDFPYWLAAAIVIAVSPASMPIAKVAEMKGRDRAMAKRLHAIIKASAPSLSPKTWYGMPAYAKDGKVVCFFQSAEKFKSRYATFGFSDEANLDKGAMWPTSFALKELTAAEEAKIGALVKKAVS